MAALSLAELRAKLKEEDERAKSIQDGTFKGDGSKSPDAFLAHWNIKEGESLILRFLPDGDENNMYFWRERTMIKLAFNGIKGGSNDRVTLQVPCNEMFEGQAVNSCPIRAEVRQWYAFLKDNPDEDLKKKASQYWGGKSYLLSCMIAPGSTQVINDLAPENPIRRVLLNKQLFTKVRSILTNPGITEMPTHTQHGRDFMVIKGKNGGGFATYDESQFSMSERPLNEAELKAIETYGYMSLDEFMPKQPTAEELVAIKEMFDASCNNEPYDPERWAQFYRPAGVQRPATTAPVTTPAQAVTETAAPAATPAPAQAVVQQEAPVTPAAQPEVKKETVNHNDILAKLRAKSGN